jgi:RNA polymerase sigma-70 factor (ECF subfamily)
MRVIRGGRDDAPRVLSDEEIIEALERSDRQLADAVYDRLIGAVESTLYRMLGARVEEHDDLVQSAFEQIVLTVRRRQYAKACSLRGWAGVITTNIALNAIRSRRRERMFVDAGLTADEAGRGRPSGADVHREVAAREDLRRLREQLADMPDTKSMPIVLHDVLGLDLAEIARLTGVSVAAAQSRLVRGRSELRKRMDDEEDPASSEGEPS